MMRFYSNPLQLFFADISHAMFDVNMQVLKTLDEFSNTDED
jgi:hypothetical protein